MASPIPPSSANDKNDFDQVELTNPGIALDPKSVRSQEDERAPFDRMEMFLDVTLEVRVELGRAKVSIQRALGLQEGSVVELDKLAGEPLDVVVNGRCVARGEAVAVGDRFGVRIVELLGPARQERR